MCMYRVCGVCISLIAHPVHGAIQYITPKDDDDARHPRHDWTSRSHARLISFPSTPPKHPYYGNYSVYTPSTASPYLPVSTKPAVQYILHLYGVKIKKKNTYIDTDRYGVQQPGSPPPSVPQARYQISAHTYIHMYSLSTSPYSMYVHMLCTPASSAQSSN